MPSTATTHTEHFNARAEAYSAKIAETLAVTGRPALSDGLRTRLSRWMSGWASEEIALTASVSDENDWDLKRALLSYKSALDARASLLRAA